MKLVSVKNVVYNEKTKSITAKFRTAAGPSLDIEIDGGAFVNLMGQANLQNSIAHHAIQNKDLPLLSVIGIQTGTAQIQDSNQYQMLLSLLVPQIGMLHFALPIEVETALREKLSSSHQ